jgi:hypothetical protein
MGAQVSARPDGTSPASSSTYKEVTPPQIEESNLQPAPSPSILPESGAGTVPHLPLDFVQNSEYQGKYIILPMVINLVMWASETQLLQDANLLHSIKKCCNAQRSDRD